MDPVLLGIDAGGTAIKAVAYTQDGETIGVGGETLDQVRPAAGHMERDPRSLWDAVCRSVRAALARAGVRPGQVSGIGVTGYGNGLWLTDGEGQPVGNGILASDTRAIEIVRAWQGTGLEPEHLRRTCQRIWPGKPAPILAWMTTHQPERLARARHLMFCKDYIRLRLTGQTCVEPTDLSVGSLIDHDEGEPQSVLDYLGLGHLRRLMPTSRDPLSTAGPLTPQAAAAIGVTAGTPVTTGVSDCAALMLGTGCMTEDMLLVVSGTWGLNQRLVPAPIRDGSILATVRGARAGDHIAIAGGPNSASAFEWLVSTFMASGSNDRAMLYEHWNTLVAGIDADAPPLYFLPFLNGTTEEPATRGGFIGLSSSHGPAHAARAVFEGVAFEHRRNVDTLPSGAALPRIARFAGGAARSAPWRGIFAATLNTPLETLRSDEAGALGAATVAAVSIGMYPSLDLAVTQMCHVRERVGSHQALAGVLAVRYRKYLALCYALRPIWGSL